MESFVSVALPLWRQPVHPEHRKSTNKQDKRQVKCFIFVINISNDVAKVIKYLQSTQFLFTFFASLNSFFYLCAV